MSITTFRLRAGALALFATLALAAAEPASAEPAKIATASSTRSDVSAVRRHHHIPRSSVRDAYGAYVGNAAAEPGQTWNHYGYGVGDNSRNQTW